MANNRVIHVAAEESKRINRMILVGVNRYPDNPVGSIAYEYLLDDQANMALSITQGAHITRNYITGGYEAAVGFKVIYRIKPGGSIDARLKADEGLDALALWASDYFRENGIGVGRVTKVEIEDGATVFGQYLNGDEDHQVLMKINYEVI